MSISLKEKGLDKQPTHNQSIFKKVQSTFYPNPTSDEEVPQPTKDNLRLSHLLASPVFKIQYIFVVQNGNNHEVVRRVLKKRPWLVEAITAKQVCNIRWKPTSQGLKYDELNQNGRLMIVNHLEHHAEITQKAKLYQNVRQYCRMHKINSD